MKRAPVDSCEKFFGIKHRLFIRLSSINQSIILPAESDTVDSNSLNFVIDSLNLWRWWFAFWRVVARLVASSSVVD